MPDYRLAPEHPFPAAKNDVQACYRGLVERGIRKIAISGDSAGGNLALVVLSLATTSGGPIPVGAAVLSPVTDLALTGESFETRSEADPYFVRAQVEGLVRSYLGDTDPKNPLASPLYGNLAGLPPIRIHVGDDEVSTTLAVTLSASSPLASMPDSTSGKACPWICWQCRPISGSGEGVRCCRGISCTAAQGRRRSLSAPTFEAAEVAQMIFTRRHGSALPARRPQQVQSLRHRRGLI